MEKLNHVRNSLRITQEKMASLLGVSRSHLAMYENGLRELPTKAMITLSEMSRYVLENPKKTAKTANPEKETAAIRKYLERQIAQTTYLQLKIEKKIANAQTKLEDAESQLQLGGFADKAKKNKPLPEPPVNLVVGEALRTLDGKLSFELYKNGLEQRKLAFELELLEAELIKFSDNKRQ